MYIYVYVYFVLAFITVDVMSYDFINLINVDVDVDALYLAITRKYTNKISHTISEYLWELLQNLDFYEL